MIVMVFTRQQAIELDSLVNGKIKSIRDKLECTKDEWERKHLIDELAAFHKIQKGITSGLDRGDLE